LNTASDNHATEAPGRGCLPELLAPAGDWECARAAVENGADAIYFGLERFNARMRAHNFTAADLPALMEFLHRRGVKGYVTFNTLVFTDELADAEEYLRAIISAGVDAAIVQDIGICRLIRRLSPDFPIHGSTQMTVTSPAGVEFAKQLGCNLVVLARENSLKEIAAIRQAGQMASGPVIGDQSSVGKAAAGLLDTDLLNTDHSGLPLEVFVHGALCVAYSGQCLTSESLGGRSANRGECAQACRMPYELVSDGQKVELGDRRYLLSPQDLAGLEVLPELVAAGVASLKIEGRLKSPEYVASITRVYRKALDALGGGKADTAAAGNSRYELEMAFSRGLYPGWFRGVQNQELAHARFGKKRGVLVGEVVRVERERVLVRQAGSVKLGDGVGFDAGRPDEAEEGGRVYEVRPRLPGSDELWLAFGHGAVNFSRIKAGDFVWKTDDPELNRELRKTFEGDAIRFQRPVRAEVHGHAGSPLTLILADAEGHAAKVQSVVPLAVAEKRPLAAEFLRDQLGRLGGTPFRLGDLANHLEGEVILPMSELNRLRRDAAAQLEALRAQPVRWRLADSGAGLPDQPDDRPPFAVATGQIPQSANPVLIVLVRNLAQLTAALECGSETIYCDFEDPKKYREAVTLFHTARGCSVAGKVEAGIFVAPPRITKPGEEWILKQVASANADGVLCRNYDHLKFFAGTRRRGDFSLNVANPLTAEYFIREHQLERVTISYDLNAAQVEALLRKAPPAWFELTLHQHMPMFHMEHCVFCAFLSTGKDYRDCGRPCDRHEVKLRDRVGQEHPLKADSGCRNTVFNARAQTGAEFLDRFRALGARVFRVEFVDETAEEVRRTLAAYRALLRGELTGQQLWQQLKLHSQLGVTRGQLEGIELRKVFPKA
jgi:putative protease